MNILNLIVRYNESEMFHEVCRSKDMSCGIVVFGGTLSECYEFMGKVFLSESAALRNKNA